VPTLSCASLSGNAESTVGQAFEPDAMAFCAWESGWKARLTVRNDCRGSTY
jgi:hypothetical protein